MNLKHKQIIDLFTDPKRAMSNGLWLSGVEGEGEYKYWYDNGQLYVHRLYKNGKLEGETKYWSLTGELWIHRLYKDDKVIKDYLE